MEPYAAGWLSILPPIIAIVLALITKEVFSSLLIGIFSGAAIYTFGSGVPDPLIKMLDVTFSLMGQKVDFQILLFCTLLGALVYVLNMSGGTKKYGEIARRKIKNRETSVLATCGLSFFIFIDDYFNCLTVGTVMKPLTDSYRVSREKLAYIIDSTAAPMCIIAPVSSWAAAVGSSLKSTGAFQSDFQAFVSTIPYNFYAIFCLLLVLYLSWTNRDFGPMKKAEENALLKSVEDEGSGATAEKPKHAQSDKGTIWDMLLPLIALIVFAVLALLYDGGYWGKDAAYHTIAAALGNCSASKALVWASFGALGVAFLMYIPRRVVSFHNFMEGTIEGMKLMLPANVILVLAWTLSGVCRDLPRCRIPEFLYRYCLGYFRYPDPDRCAGCCSRRPLSDNRLFVCHAGRLCFRRPLLTDFRYNDSFECGQRMQSYFARVNTAALRMVRGLLLFRWLRRCRLQ